MMIDEANEPEGAFGSNIWELNEVLGNDSPLLSSFCDFSAPGETTGLEAVFRRFFGGIVGGKGVLEDKSLTDEMSDLMLGIVGAGG